MTYCLRCGPVDHQPIPEDEAHCPCYRDLSLRPCTHACHTITDGRSVPSPSAVA